MFSLTQLYKQKCHLRFYPITMSVTLICVTAAEMLISLQQQNSTFALWQGTLKHFSYYE